MYCPNLYNRGGALVDYIGDAILAIWGAPELQTDHAERACLAAIEMVSCLSELGPVGKAFLESAWTFPLALTAGWLRWETSGHGTNLNMGPLAQPSTFVPASKDLTNGWEHES